LAAAWGQNGLEWRASADTPSNAIIAILKSAPIKPDGRLDEAAWRAAEPARDWQSVQRGQAGVAAHRIRILDDEASTSAPACSTLRCRSAHPACATHQCQPDWIEFVFDNIDHIATTSR
jgi:hypothetical protein